MSKKMDIYPWGSFEMDDATGLPIAPEGYFFRVTRRSLGFWSVQLRRRGVLWSRKVEDRTWRGADPINQETILYGAAHVLSQFKERALKQPEDKALVGNYPPKRLKD